MEKRISVRYWAFLHCDHLGFGDSWEGRMEPVDKLDAKGQERNLQKEAKK